MIYAATVKPSRVSRERMSAESRCVMACHSDWPQSYISDAQPFYAAKIISRWRTLRDRLWFITKRYPLSPLTQYFCKGKIYHAPRLVLHTNCTRQGRTGRTQMPFGHKEKTLLLNQLQCFAVFCRIPWWSAWSRWIPTLYCEFQWVTWSRFSRLTHVSRSYFNVLHRNAIPTLQS